MNATDKGAYQKQRADHVTLQLHPSGIIYLAPRVKREHPPVGASFEEPHSLHMIS